MTGNNAAATNCIDVTGWQYGGTTCAMCGGWIPGGTGHLCTGWQRQWWLHPTIHAEPQVGWKCGCGITNAPWMPYCTTCAPKRPDTPKAT